MSLLVISPHMDDETLGCGGLIQRVEDVRVVFVSEKATDLRRVDDEYVAYDGAARVAEMEEVAELLGFEPIRLGHAVHTLDQVPMETLIGQLEELIAASEMIAVPGPSNDQDHEVVRRAVAACKRPHLYDGSVVEYFTWGGPNPFEAGLFLPLTVGEMRRKMEAMSMYATQVAPDGDEDRLYVYAPASIDAYARSAGRLIHKEFAEVHDPKRLVPNATTAEVLSG